MTQFKVKNVDELKGQEPSDVIKMFLSSVDPTWLSEQVLDDMGWGGGDPITATLTKLLELADEW